MGNKRGSRCPDCGGPHGRGYYSCPNLGDIPLEEMKPSNFEEIEARMLTHYEAEIGRMAYAALRASHEGSVKVLISVLHDEVTVEVIE